MNVASPVGGERAFVGRGVRLELVVDPLLEVGRVEGDDLHPHVGVAEPAELGALPGVDAGLPGLEPPRVHAARHHVALAVELGHPERVDDVAARAADQHVGVGGDHHLAAGDDRCRGHARHVVTADRAVGGDRVVVLPPPLLPGDVDLALRVVGLVELEDRVDREPADHGQQRRGDGDERVLDDGVAVRLLGDRLAAVLEADHAVQDDGEHDHADDPGDQEHPPLQVLDRLGVRRRPASTCPGARPERTP